MIDLDGVVSLRAVARCGSVAAAADALGYTPSAVSQQVKRLERQLGLGLLERVGRGVVLTGPGRQLVEDGAAVLTEIERIQSGLHHASGAVAGRLRLAAFSTAVRGLVAPALGPVLPHHRELTVTIDEREPWETVDLVATGQADVGVVHSWGDVPLAVPDHLVASALTQDVADVIARRDHLCAQSGSPGRAALTPRDLLDARWVATPEGTICRQWLDRMYVGTGRTPDVAHVSREFDSHLALVQAGLGVALVPRIGRSALPPDVVAVEVRDPVPTRQITMLHRRSMDASPAIRLVVETLCASVRSDDCGGPPGALA